MLFREICFQRFSNVCITNKPNTLILIHNLNRFHCPFNTNEFDSLLHHTIPIRISIPQDKKIRLHDALSHDGKEIVPFYYARREKQKSQIRFDDKCRTAESLGLIHKFINE